MRTKDKLVKYTFWAVFILISIHTVAMFVLLVLHGFGVSGLSLEESTMNILVASPVMAIITLVGVLAGYAAWVIKR